VNKLETMKAINKVLMCGLLAVAVSSCTITAPLTASTAEIGDKRGESETVVLFGAIYLNKDYGVKQAAENGKITSAIATMDVRTTNFLIFSKKALIVTAK
jgi:hypothetical protein